MFFLYISNHLGQAVTSAPYCNLNLEIVEGNLLEALGKHFQPWILSGFAKGQQHNATTRTLKFKKSVSKTWNGMSEQLSSSAVFLIRQVSAWSGNLYLYLNCTELPQYNSYWGIVWIPQYELYTEEYTGPNERSLGETSCSSSVYYPSIIYI